MLIICNYRPSSQTSKRAYVQWGIHTRSHSGCMLYFWNRRCWRRKHWRCLTLIRQPTEIGENLIYHLWGRLGWQSLILHLFIFPILPFYNYFFSRWRSHWPSIRWARCSSSSPRGRPPTTSTTPSCRCSSSSYSPSGWLRRTLSRRCWFGAGLVVALVLTICEIEWRWSDTNSYRLDTNWAQVVARKKEWKSEIFPKVL